MRTNSPPTPYLINLFELKHCLYNITFDSNHTVQTLVTSSPDLVDCWFIDTEALSVSFPVIGLHIEWSSSNTPATIHLCINNICLIYQVIHAPHVCPSLSIYLSNPRIRFVVVGIKDGIEKLQSDYSLRVANFVDLRSVAAEKLRDRKILKSTGIKMLAERVLGKVVKKPQSVVMSRWDSPWLNDDQVKYATLNAYAAFEIGRRLYSTCNNWVYSNNNRVYPNDFRVPWCRIIFVFLSMLFMTGIILDFGVK
ncbi:Werner Syndrome exonuclease [Trifolium repens]|nr:Werner Syndrome exonuclease [Trifolium repens]